jgi:hypothetical protein
MIKLRNLRWENYPVLSGRTQCSHRCPSKEKRQAQRFKNALKTEEGAKAKEFR